MNLKDLTLEELKERKAQMIAEYTSATESLRNLQAQLTESRGKTIYLEGYIDGKESELQEAERTAKQCAGLPMDDCAPCCNPRSVRDAIKGMEEINNKGSYQAGSEQARLPPKRTMSEL